MKKVKLTLPYENLEMAAFARYELGESCQFVPFPEISASPFPEDLSVLVSTYDLFRCTRELSARVNPSCNENVIFQNEVGVLEDSRITVDRRLTVKKSDPQKTFDAVTETKFINNPYFAKIIGNCDGMKKVKNDLQLVCEKDCKVLFCGESGTGKSLIASVLHKLSLRKNAEFVNVNVGALQKDLIEATLFGTVKGAYTDAQDRRGLLAVANNGTIFLDEIGEMPLSCQVKLLHTLDDGRFRKVGSNIEERTNARFIFATNANLKEMVRKKLFREDLYWRIAEFTINVPPLRKRNDDIILLAEYFLSQTNLKGKKARYFTESAKEKIKAYNWPGNIRELRSSINIATIFAKSEEIDADDIQLGN